MPRRRRELPPPGQPADREPSELRIIGGDFRGRKLKYSGRFGTRPMKDRLREAIFNLVGPSIRGLHAVDLFAGTGALGLEALSRGAAAATLLEIHVPTARVIEENVAALDLSARAQVLASSAFVWAKQPPDGAFPSLPWAVFCSPPYDFFVEKQDVMLTLLRSIVDRSPPGSLIVVEADARFDFGLLPAPTAWDVRTYAPAIVGIWRKEVTAPCPLPTAP